MRSVGYQRGQSEKLTHEVTLMKYVHVTAEYTGKIMRGRGSYEETVKTCWWKPHTLEQGNLPGCQWRSLTVLFVSRLLIIWVNQRNRHWYVALQWLNNIDECWREDASTSNDQQPVKQYTIQHTRCSYNNSHTRFSKGHPEIYSYMTIVLNVQAVLFWAFRSRSFLTLWS